MAGQGKGSMTKTTHQPETSQKEGAVSEGKEQKVYLFGEGMPTGPDVAALQKQWPDLKRGDLIPYEDVEIVIGADRHSARFRSCTNVWRKEELNKGIVIECRRATEFYVAGNSQVIALTPVAYDAARKKIRKQYKKVATINPENEIEKAAKLHQLAGLTRMSVALKDSKVNAMPSLAAPAPTRLVTHQTNGSSEQATHQ